MFFVFAFACVPFLSVLVPLCSVYVITICYLGVVVVWNCLCFVLCCFRFVDLFSVVLVLYVFVVRLLLLCACFPFRFSCGSGCVGLCPGFASVLCFVFLCRVAL